MIRKILILMLFLLSVSINVFANPPAPTSSSSSSKSTTGVDCPNANISWFSDICWDCIFPIKLGGTTWFSIGSGVGSEQDPNGDWEGSSPVCICKDNNGVPDFGFQFSFFTISRIYEVVRKPYCEPFLGMDLSGIGASTFTTPKFSYGTRGGNGDDDGDKIMYHVHYIIFPLLQLLDVAFNVGCEEGYYSDLNIGFLSETALTWQHDEWTIVEHPEAVIFTNPITQMACVADCIATNVGYPIDKLFWCAGCLGSTYPFAGSVTNTHSPLIASQLNVLRMLSLLHRVGLAWKTKGEDALCGGYVYPIIPKSQYKLSMLFPIAQASGKCCHPLGRSSFINNTEWRNIPGFGEDFLYLQFTKMDCCVR